MGKYDYIPVTGESGKTYKVFHPSLALMERAWEDTNDPHAEYSLPCYSRFVDIFLSKSVRDPKFRAWALDICRRMVTLADERDIRKMDDEERGCSAYAYTIIEECHVDKCLHQEGVNNEEKNGHVCTGQDETLTRLECEESLLYLNKALRYTPDDPMILYPMAQRYHRLYKLDLAAKRAKAAEESLRLRDKYLKQAAEDDHPWAALSIAVLELCSQDPEAQARGEKTLQDMVKRNYLRAIIQLAKIHWLRGDTDFINHVKGLQAYQVEAIQSLPTNLSDPAQLERYFTDVLG